MREKNIIVKNEADITDIYLMMALSQQVKDTVTMVYA